MANSHNLKPFTGADDPRRMNGKPKGTIHVKTLAKRIANDLDTWDKMSIKDPESIRKKVGHDKTVLEALIIAWLGEAKRDARFANVILELLDGKGQVKVKHSGSIGKHMSEDELDGVIKRYEEAISKRQDSQS